MKNKIMDMYYQALPVIIFAGMCYLFYDGVLK